MGRGGNMIEQARTQAGTDPAFVPALPHAAGGLDWADWTARMPLLQAMDGCEQDPVFHAEGDVLVHTRAVVDELLADPAWQELLEAEREELFWAALLHDCGKPARLVREPDGKLSSAGHSSTGARLARELLWRAGVSPERRERVCALVRFHMRPYYLLERDDPQRAALEIAASVSPAALRVLCRADTRGRIAPDLEARLEDLELFYTYCEEQGIATGALPFASEHSRFLYFRTPGRDPHYAAHDTTRSTLTLLSGLPGAGKDSWLEANRPELAVISLDEIRSRPELKRANQGEIGSLAREQAREHLRAGRDFAWNATNLSRHRRSQVIDLAAAYDARIEIVCLEASPEELYARNRARPDGGVERKKIDALVRKWEAPDLTEAHSLLVVG